MVKFIVFRLDLTMQGDNWFCHLVIAFWSLPFADLSIMALWSFNLETGLETKRTIINWKMSHNVWLEIIWITYLKYDLWLQPWMPNIRVDIRIR